MVRQFWYAFWAIMTILIKGLKIRPNWWPTLNWAHPLMGCAADVIRHVNCHVSSHVIDHVNLHVIIAIHVITKSTATSSSMSSTCDMTIQSVTKIILFVTFIFVIKNGIGLGFGGPGTFYDGFKTS